MDQRQFSRKGNWMDRREIAISLLNSRILVERALNLNEQMMNQALDDADLFIKLEKAHADPKTRGEHKS